jgi:gamma-glutamylcysteine synthetase
MPLQKPELGVSLWPPLNTRVVGVGLPQGGLERRGLKEESFLKDLHEMVETGKTQADVLLDKFNGEWEGNIDRVYNSNWLY